MKYVFELPSEMLAENSRRGTLERFSYDSFTYEEENRPLHKNAWVYLPWGYDSSRPCPVLYLLHGGGVNEDWWFQMFPDTVRILDNMMAKKLCEPCIIVAPTYYRGDSGDQNAEYITEHFHHELRRDLIPAVESTYSTWAKGDVSEENLRRTRRFRAFAGLSLGSMTTYRAAFYHNFDLFSWYGPFSGCCGPKGDHQREVERICHTLAEGEKAGLTLDFMLCCNGDRDIAYEEHLDIMTKALQVCPQLIPEKNYHFFTIPGGVHDMKAWQLHLYHALQIFFRGSAPADREDR